MHAGLFMAQQEKVLACGPSFAALGLVLKFALGPAAMAIGSIAVGLRGDVLRVAIIQVSCMTSFQSTHVRMRYSASLLLLPPL
jgi:auxin efflux carrier family protein